MSIDYNTLVEIYSISILVLGIYCLSLSLSNKGINHKQHNPYIGSQIMLFVVNNFPVRKPVDPFCRQHSRIAYLAHIFSCLDLDKD